MLGIGGEVIFGMMNSRIQTELRDRSNARVETANVIAAEAHERAAKADWERAKLEANIRARSLIRAQFETLGKLQGKLQEVIIASVAVTAAEQRARSTRPLYLRAFGAGYLGTTA